MNMEVWKPIPGWEALYEVSNRGSVRSLSSYRDVCFKGRMILRKVKGRILKAFVDKNGYRNVGLCERERQLKIKISRLVLYAFVSVQPSSVDACHNDGNRSNDVLSNLRWDSRKGNMKDCKEHGTHYTGADHINSKISQKDVIEIQEMIFEKVSYSLIAAKYGICKQSVCNIKKGRSYQNVNLETV